MVPLSSVDGNLINNTHESLVRKFHKTKKKQYKTYQKDSQQRCARRRNLVLNLFNSQVIKGETPPGGNIHKALSFGTIKGYL